MIYTKTSPEPGEHVIQVIDCDGDPWLRQPHGGWTRPDSTLTGPRSVRWTTVTRYAPLDDGLEDEAPAPTVPVAQSAITPKIRMWALDFTLRAIQEARDHLAPGIDILTVADNYARYAATGEHFQ